jgi:hypothetical protein
MMKSHIIVALLWGGNKWDVKILFLGKFWFQFQK